MCCFFYLVTAIPKQARRKAIQLNFSRNGREPALTFSTHRRIQAGFSMGGLPKRAPDGSAMMAGRGDSAQSEACGLAEIREMKAGLGKNGKR